MAVRLDKDVRQVVVLRGGSGRRVYDVDRDDDDNDIRITVIRRDETGRLIARERYEGEGPRRKKQSKLLKPIERTLRNAVRFETRLLNDYLSRHERSNAKKRNGWVKDLPTNLVRAIRKSKPRRIFRRS
jgi:hypothetical protein